MRILIDRRSLCVNHNIDNNFYNEALLGISKLHIFKNYPDINKEHFFYNKIFVTSVDDEVHGA